MAVSGKGGRFTGGKVALEAGPMGSGGNGPGALAGRVWPVGDKVAGLMGPGVQLGMASAGRASLVSECFGMLAVGR